jgi:acetoin utilization protein AcuB
MRSKNIRHLPVIENERLVGIVSDRDLKAAMSLPQSKQLSLSDIMTTDVFAVPSHMTLTHVAQQMAERKLGSVLIVNDANEVIGIFTTTDALNLLAGYTRGETMEQYLGAYRSWPSSGKAVTTFATAFSLHTEE